MLSAKPPIRRSRSSAPTTRLSRGRYAFPAGSFVYPIQEGNNCRSVGPGELGRAGLLSCDGASDVKAQIDRRMSIHLGEVWRVAGIRWPRN